jgi:hypothetical protein
VVALSIVARSQDKKLVLGKFHASGVQRTSGRIMISGTLKNFRHEGRFHVQKSRNVFRRFVIVQMQVLDGDSALGVRAHRGVFLRNVIDVFGFLGDIELPPRGVPFLSQLKADTEKDENNPEENQSRNHIMERNSGRHATLREGSF